MKMRLELLFMAGIIALDITAEKCRQIIGDEMSSKGMIERFTFLNCFDMSTGTMACTVKECVKLYCYYRRAVHVQEVRNKKMEATLYEYLSQGQTIEEALNQANEKGNAAAKEASRQVKHIIGPAISFGWDLFETIYIGGTLVEGIMRGTGTFLGSYVGGIIGEERLRSLRWLGFLVGSQMGSWVGGRVGLMAYDVGKGVQYLLQFVHKGTNLSSLASKDL
ncbi:uncharacterized protein LOC114268074 [Camellia sinensis]|uniref:uncharacterized protein LOC114268074 n=1 Tax=Camellia sinensis TaxID=4442 RepID=UPI001035C29A|nr:uncharacterized protein LOC114268074 [Camellia sinensis]